MSGETPTTTRVACPSCGAENRVDPARAAQAVCGRCKAPLQAGAAGHPVDVTQASFAQEVLQATLPVVVDFWAPWCGPCRMMAPTFEAAARKMAGRIKFARVNTDDNQALAGSMGIRSIPTLVLFRGGREVKRTAGAQSAEALEAFLRG